jgi:transcriptional regulator with XRE-family HTH domain
MEYSDDVYIKRMGERIKELRTARSMTQLDVAIKSGMEENAFQRIESGRTNPSTKTLIKITQALDISMREFFQFDVP